MGWILSTVVLTGLLIAGLLYARSMRKYPASGRTDEEAAHVSRIASFVAFGVYAFLMAVMTFIASAHQIEAGNVGVVYQFGAISGQISEGLQFTAPWQGVRVESIQVQRHTFDDISAASMETQDVFIRATVNFSVSPEAIQNLFRTVGPNWFDRLVQSRVLNYFKEETVKYKTVDILPNREAIRTAVKERLIASLEPYSVTVVDLLIDNVTFNKEFLQAIENKQIATQEALKQKELVQVALQQAQQRIEQARGEAEATLIQAEAQAQANQKLNASLTPILVQWSAIQNLSDNVQLVLVPSDGNFLYNLGGKVLP